MAPPPLSDDHVRAFGNQLVEVHIWLREQLARLRDDLAAPPERPRDLRVHCLTFCAALRRHHTGEDGSLFPLLTDGHPDLAPVLEALERDHAFVDGILRRVEELVASAEHADAGDAAVGVRAELDGLAALLDSHFAYEERRLAAVLNDLGDGRSTPAGADVLLDDGW